MICPPLARPATPGVRILAMLTDLAVFDVVYVPLSFLLIGSSRRGPAWTSAYLGNALALAIGLLEIVAAASPGKLLFRLRIVAVGDSPAGQRALALRYLLKFSPRFIGLVHALLLILSVKQSVAWAGFCFFRDRPIDYVCLPIVGELLLLMLAGGYALILRRDGRALHDLLAGTQVVRLPRRSGRQGFEPVMAQIAQTEPAQAGVGGRLVGLPLNTPSPKP